MSKYYKAEDVIRAIAEQLCWEARTEYGDKFTTEDWLEEAEDYVLDLPTIEVIKEGEWKFKKTFPNDDSEFPMGYLVCSVCGSQHANATPCNYCDNCGAKMKGAE